MLIDTHCHLDFNDFDQDRDAVLERAFEAGVGKIVDVGSSMEGSRRAVELSKKYDMVYATVGIHPHHAEEVTDRDFDEIRALASQKKVVAIGEVGLDYYRNLSPKESQIAVFRRFISLAREFKLPLVIHTRDSNDDFLRVMREETPIPRGVVHCFAGDENFLKACLDMGLYISFTGNMTFKKADDLRRVAKYVPVERLMLETDAPYLAPQAVRGKRNEPSYLKYLVDEWVGISGLSGEDIARITTHNANSLFGLGVDEKTKIAYPIRDSLYLNITNRCTNSCYFCVRNSTEFVKGHNLKLDREPDEAEILEAIGDPSRYREVVFCGYGEPTMRLDVVKAIAANMKRRGLAVRLNTNGHGDLANKRPIASELAGLVDKVCVSLNAQDAEIYTKLCKPAYGEKSYEALKSFIRDCVARGIEVEATCLDLPLVDAAKCEEIAKSLGASFRPRHYGVVG